MASHEDYTRPYYTDGPTPMTAGREIQMPLPLPHQFPIYLDTTSSNGTDDDGMLDYDPDETQKALGETRMELDQIFQTSLGLVPDTTT